MSFSRYRDILVRGATEQALAPEWLAKLKSVPTYKASPETLAVRAAFLPPHELPSMTIDELAKLTGETPDTEPHTSACG